MRQEIANPTKGMVALEQRFGRPVEDIVRERYVRDGASMPTVARELGIDTSTLSRWMVRWKIPARIFASERPDAAA